MECKKGKRDVLNIMRKVEGGERFMKKCRRLWRGGMSAIALAAADQPLAPNVRRCLSFFILLLVFGQRVDAAYKFPENEEKFIAGMAGYFADGKYAHLEKLAEIIRSSKSRYPGGDWKIVCFYAGMRRVPGGTKAGEKAWENHQNKFKKWMREYPDSVTAKTAYAAFLCDYAWKARGGGWASSVDKDQWSVFRERLGEAEDVLIRAGKLKEKCPVWFSIMQTVALGQGWDRDRYEKLFSDAISFEPLFWDYYYTKAHYLLPRWHGKKREWEEYAETVSKKIGGKEGSAVYAYICKMLTRYYPHDGFFGVADVDWEKLKKGMQDIEKLYGSSNRHLNEFLRMACLAGDKKTAKELFDWLEDDWDKYVWAERWRFEQYREWAYSPGKGDTGVWKKDIAGLKGLELKDFGFKDINGDLIKMSRLGSDLILINVWRPGDEASFAEIGVLNKLREEFTEKELKIIGLSRGNKSLAEHFTGVNYPLVMIDFIPHPFSKVKDYPVSFIVSKDGFILEVMEGLKTHEELKRAILKNKT